jgi:hypothetical protein
LSDDLILNLNKKRFIFCVTTKIMKFLVLCAPIIKFLMNKYLPNLPPSVSVQSSDVIKRFINSEMLMPEESKIFINSLKELQTFMITSNSAYKVSPLKKLIGDSKKWSGFLNLLVLQNIELYIFAFEPNTLEKLYTSNQNFFKNDGATLRIIAPLNIDESDEIYTFFHSKLHMPVSPFLLNFETSKWLLLFFFGSYAPRTFFFPDGTFAYEYVDKMQKIAKRDNIEYFFLKDEYDYDLSSLIPYTIAPTDKLEFYCKSFYEKSKGIPNVGGLLVQEFLTSNSEINIYRSHIYNQIIPKSSLYYKVKIKPYKEGILFNEAIESNQMTAIEIPDYLFQTFNPIIAQAYPFLFSSIDYIMLNNTPKVIDVNSISNCLSKDPEIDILNMDSIFNFFISGALNENPEDTYNKQIQYQTKISKFYKYIKSLGPCYISGDILTKLKDESIVNVKDISNEKY